MEEFKIRAYSKKELALLYFPTAASPHAAINHLMGWIKRCKGLTDELEKKGYQKTAKYFTSREIRAIIRQIGEP